MPLTDIQRFNSKLVPKPRDHLSGTSKVRAQVCIKLRDHLYFDFCVEESIGTFHAITGTKDMYFTVHYRITLPIQIKPCCCIGTGKILKAVHF